MAEHPLIELANSDDVKEVKLFQPVAVDLTGDKLAEMFRTEQANAPSLPDDASKFFVGHDGNVENPAKAKFDRDHLAIALWNHAKQSNLSWNLPDGSSIDLLDYGVAVRPVKDKGPGIRKFDLVGLADDDRVVVVALRFMPKKSTKGDTPLQILLDGLAACAIAQAKQDALQSELSETFEREVSTEPPVLVVAANDRYWELYRRRATKTAGPWIEQLERLGKEIEASLGILVRFISLNLTGDPAWEIRDAAPTLLAKPRQSSALKVKAKTRKGAVEEPEIVEANPDRAPRAYSMADVYEPGDTIEHSVLGKGVVQASIGPMKIAVLFRGEKRILAQGKK